MTTPKFLTIVYAIESEHQQTELLAGKWASVMHGDAVKENTALKDDIRQLEARIDELGRMARENRSRAIVELESNLKKANELAEHFEREWYLRGDEIEVLKVQLEAIGAGGVEPLRKRTCLHQIQEPSLSRACDLLSSAIGILMGQRAKIAYTDNSPIAALVNDVVEFLRPWPEQLPSSAAAPIFGDEDHVLIPRALISAACSAIDKKRDGSKVLAELRRYTTGDLSKAQPPVAQEPVAWRIGPDRPDCYRFTNIGLQAEAWEKQGWAVEPLYTHPAPVRKPLTDKRIAEIVRDAAKNSAIRRDGTTSHRIVRAVEAAHSITRDPLSEPCKCGKETVAWCLSNSCHKAGVQHEA